jgi:hypothetical protein
MSQTRIALLVKSVAKENYSGKMQSAKGSTEHSLGQRPSRRTQRGGHIPPIIETLSFVAQLNCHADASATAQEYECWQCISVAKFHPLLLRRKHTLSLRVK